MTTRKKILLVGDAALLGALREAFASCADLALAEAESREAALAAAGGGSPDLVLLADSIEAPGAAALAAELRAAGHAGPILLLAESESAPPGFDERLARPIRFSDLLSRVRARLSGFSSAKVAIGPFVLRADRPELTGPDGARIALTEKEAAILARLAREQGAAASRDALLRDVWGYGPAVSTRTLETHIHRLRRKLEADPARPRLLLTAPGGYRLAAPSGEGEKG
jgi:DNA-binding response OmpR family regulator